MLGEHKTCHVCCETENELLIQEKEREREGERCFHGGTKDLCTRKAQWVHRHTHTHVLGSTEATDFSQHHLLLKHCKIHLTQYLARQTKNHMQIYLILRSRICQKYFFNIALLSLHFADCRHSNRERNSQSHITPKMLHRAHKKNKTYQHTRKYLHAPLPRRPDWILQGICILQRITSSLGIHYIVAK